MDEPGGASIVMNITTPTVVKASPGRVAIIRCFPIAYGVFGGTTVHNCITTGAATAANKIGELRTVTNSGQDHSANLQIPCDVGIVVLPGNANTITYVTYT